MGFTCHVALGGHWTHGCQVSRISSRWTQSLGGLVHVSRKQKRVKGAVTIQDGGRRAATTVMGGGKKDRNVEEMRIFLSSMRWEAHINHLFSNFVIWS